MCKRILRLAALFAIPVFVSLVSCNSGNGNNAVHKTDTVVIEQMKFNPQTITVNKGDTVLFINKDIVEHNATEDNKAWQSPTLQMGDSWKFVPEKSADYYCSIHIVMKGRIEVK